MPTSFHKQGIILLILVVCVLCVTPVLAWGEHYTYTPDFNKTIADKYATEINGNYYLNKHIDIDFINDYIKVQSPEIFGCLWGDVYIATKNCYECIAETYIYRDIYQTYDGDALIASYTNSLTGENITYYAHTGVINALAPELLENDFYRIITYRCYPALSYTNPIYGHDYKIPETN